MVQFLVVTHDCVVHPPLLQVQGIASLKRQLFHVVITRGVSTELLLVASSGELLVVVTSDVLRPVVIDVDVSAAEEVGLLLRKMHVGDLTGHLLPVLERDVPDGLPRLELVLIWRRIRLVGVAVVIVVVLVVLEAVLVSGDVCRKLLIVDTEKLYRLAMRMVEEQFDTAEVGEMLVCANWLVTGEVVEDPRHRRRLKVHFTAAVCRSRQPRQFTTTLPLPRRS